MSYRKIPFGDLRIGSTARRYIQRALDNNWVSEGPNVHEFEARFSEKFHWKHAIACSSGTDAGIVVWSAVKELCYGAAQWEDAAVVTPACAFVATANCLLASKIWLRFVDIDIDTLNMSPATLEASLKDSRLSKPIGIQFVATMGKPTPIIEVAKIADEYDLYLIGDFCEAYGSRLGADEIVGGSHFMGPYADYLCDAAIYSFYCAHMIVAGEGGMICTDDDEIAALCRSIKCHGYGDGPRFNFMRIGFNSKMNELTAAIGIEGLEKFDEDFKKRRAVRAGLIERLTRFKDELILYRDAPGEVIAPHAFPIVLRDDRGDTGPLRMALKAAGIECKSLFGSLPTDHTAFRFLGHRPGGFPIAESIGRRGLHFSCNQFLTDDDVIYIADRIGKFLWKEKS